jgi:hypothetical protein
VRASSNSAVSFVELCREMGLLATAGVAIASGHPVDERHQRDRPALGISAYDHIIVGKNGHTRLEGLKLIPLASSTTARDATIWLF